MKYFRKVNCSGKFNSCATSLTLDGAATQKQHDDISAHIRFLEGQLEATLSTLGKNTASINDNSAALEAQIAALNDRIAKCHIVAPVSGTVLMKYAEAGELSTVGKPLMKIANLEKIYLRAYINAAQLTELQLGQTVTVFADQGKKDRRSYEGKLIWIADKAEFTPKTIQTRDERANLVYAIKIAVKNDGLIKQGMYGEVKFKKQRSMSIVLVNHLTKSNQKGKVKALNNLIFEVKSANESVTCRNVFRSTKT